MTDPANAPDDTLDEALRRLAATGPNWGPGFANHGPMAAEALIAMGRPQAVAGFLDRYSRDLEPAPAPGRPFARAELMAALGDAAAFPRFEATFARELAERPWRAVAGAWASRLMPGLSGSLAHGVIRTAHAVRALGAHETPERRQELARALAYWASHHQSLPRMTAGPAAAADELLDATARQFVHHGADAPIFFLHTVTAVAAVGLLLPLLGESAEPRAIRHAARFVASIRTQHGRTPQRSDGVEAPAVPVDELIDRAVGHGDEHAIKLTSACVINFARTRRQALLAAAQRGRKLM